MTIAKLPGWCVGTADRLAIGFGGDVGRSGLNPVEVGSCDCPRRGWTVWVRRWTGGSSSRNAFPIDYPLG